jgi:transglutaminase-like putative cysteine protease
VPCALVALLCGCQSTQSGRTAADDSSAEGVPHVVTADIQAGIEAYVEEQTRLGNGEFVLDFDGQELRLKLVRVHTEYLANLGPHRHFACVDLATAEGNVYDVDFFMAGDPGAMTVTETTVHKINGRPYYLWEQQDDGVWVRAPVDDAAHALLGVVEGADRFEFLYEFKLPELADDARMWMPLPQSDEFQTIRTLELAIPGKQRVLTDQRYGNSVLFCELSPADSGRVGRLRVEVTRLEKGVHADPATSPSDFLTADRKVPVDGEFREIAEEVLEGKHGDLVRARALYDHTIDRMRYAKFGTQYGKGDAQYACDSGAGNCTDYHSYFIALARSVGIPARFAIGAAVPSNRDEGALSGYHCWAEFYAEGKWWPVDISEADKYTALATYYFGHNPANRVEFSRGRDLVVEPGPESGPINFLAYPVLEVGGEPVKLKPRLSFTRITTTGGGPQAATP